MREDFSSNEDVPYGDTLSDLSYEFKKKESLLRERPREAAVPVHPEPMEEGGRVFGEDGWEPAL